MKKLFLLFLSIVTVAIGWQNYKPDLQSVAVEQEVIGEVVLETESVLQQEEVAETEKSSVIGIWQSVDDTNAVVVYQEGGVLQNYYDGVVVDTGTWLESVKDFDTHDEHYLHLAIDGDVQVYTLLEVTDTILELRYTGRGNTLIYNRIETVPENGSSVVQTYFNEEYQFSVKHPSDWEVIESLKPQEVYALQEIKIWEREYDQMWRGSMSVYVFANPEQDSVKEWWNAWLSVEDKKEQECKEEYNDTAPCLFLRGLVESEELVTVSGKEAIAVQLFRFDHSEVCTYVAEGEYVYGLCAPGSNPNDPNEVLHREITDSIRESFTFSR